MLQQQGIEVEVFPLINERAKVIHAEAKPFVARAHYLPVFSLSILFANLYFLMKNRLRISVCGWQCSAAPLVA
ncbi:MAG: hypothetical protein U0074_00165 [Kouleothrix sp.]